MASSAFWDTSLPNTGGGGAVQHLALSNTTLYLIPDGGHVVLPTGYTSNTSNIIVQTMTVQSNFYMNNNLNPTASINTLGVANFSNVLAHLGSFYTTNANGLNATTGSINTLTTTTGSISNLTTSNLSASNVAIANSATVGSQIQVGSLLLTPNLLSNGANLTAKTNLSIDPAYSFTATNASITNISNINTIVTTNISTNTLTASNIIASCNLATGTLLLTEPSGFNHTLVGSINPIYDGQIIQVGTQGDASQWSRYGALQDPVFNNRSINDAWNINAQGSLNVATTGQSGQSVNIGQSFNANFISYSQPALNAYTSGINLAAGAAVSPPYVAGRAINVDAYAGTAPQVLGGGSVINLTAHGNTTIPISPAKYLAAAGSINLTAYNSYQGIVPDPTANGTITLNAAQVNVGNNNSTPFGGTTFVTVQGLIVTLISGTVLYPGSLLPDLPTLQIRAGHGVEIYTDLTNSTRNTDSVLRVKDIRAQSNDVYDPFGEYLTLDGLSGGVTLLNFKEADGQGAGANLYNIANITGAYNDSITSNFSTTINYIDATNTDLQMQINEIVSNGGSNLSNISRWWVWPAQSNLLLNQDIAFYKSGGGISTINGLTIGTFGGSLAPVSVSQVNLNSVPITYTDALNVGTASNLKALRTSTIVMNTQGTDYLLQAFNANLTWNGNQLVTTNYLSNLGQNSNFTNLNALSINANTFSTLAVYGPLMAMSSLMAPLLTLTSNGGYGACVTLTTDPNGSYSLLNYYNSNTTATNIASVYNTGTNSYNLTLCNVTSINGLPYVPGGGSGTSNLSNWSLLPVVPGQPLQFGSQIAQIQGNIYAIFNNQLGNPMRVVGSEFTPLNIAQGVQVKFGIANSNAAVLDMGNNYATLGVSNIVFNNLGQVSADQNNLYFNGSNYLANWFNYGATAPIIASNGLVLTQPGVDGAKQIQITNGSALLNVNSYLDGTTVFSTQPSLKPIVMETGTVIVRTGNYSGAPTSQISSSNVVSASIVINSNTLTTDVNNNLTFNGAILNTSNSIANWANYSASGTIESDFGIQCYGSNAVSMIQAQNSIATCALTLDASGNLNIVNDISLHASPATITYIGNNHLIKGLASFYASNSSPVGITINGFDISGCQSIDISGSIIKSDGSNCYINGNPIVTGSYTTVNAGSCNYTYPYNTGSISGFRLPITAPTTEYCMVSFSLTTPAGFFENGGSNYMRVYCQADDIFVVNVKLPPNATNPGGAYFYQQNLSFMVKTVGYPNIYLNMAANYSGVYQFSNIIVKPLVD